MAARSEEEGGHDGTGKKRAFRHKMKKQEAKITNGSILGSRFMESDAGRRQNAEALASALRHRKCPAPSLAN